MRSGYFFAFDLFFADFFVALAVFFAFFADTSFHLIISDPTEQVLGQELPGLVADGYTSFKVFMTYEGLALADREILEVMSVARETGALVMVHAENYDAIRFLTDRLELAGKTQATPASKADMIASLTQRTTTERMEEDPVYFEKISALIQKAIDDHRAQRISQLEFLNIVRGAREQVVRPKHDDVPQHLRGNDTAVAFYHAIEKHLGAVRRPDLQTP